MDEYREQIDAITSTPVQFPRQPVFVDVKKQLKERLASTKNLRREEEYRLRKQVDEFNTQRQNDETKALMDMDYGLKRIALLNELKALEEAAEKKKKDIQNSYKPHIDNARAASDKIVSVFRNEVYQLDHLLLRCEKWEDSVPYIQELPLETNVPAKYLPHLFDFQVATIHRMLQVNTIHNCGVLGNKVGTGKTRTALIFAATYIAANARDKVFIVVPSRMIHHWMEELAKISDDTNKLNDDVAMYRDLRDIKKIEPRKTKKRIHVLTSSIIKKYRAEFPLNGSGNTRKLFICDELDTFLTARKYFAESPFTSEWIISATASTRDRSCGDDLQMVISSSLGHLPNPWCNVKTDCMVRTSAEFVQSAFEIPPVTTQKIRCLGVAQDIRQLLPREIINLINQGCMTEAIERAGGSSSSLNVATALTQGYEKKHKKALADVTKHEKELDLLFWDAGANAESADKKEKKKLEMICSVLDHEMDDMSQITDDMIKATEEIIKKNIATRTKDAEDFENKIALIKERLADTHCPICITDEDDKPSAVTECCQQRMCLECLMYSLEQRQSCPICRSNMKNKTSFQIIHADPVDGSAVDGSAVDESAKEGKRPRDEKTVTKQETLNKLISEGKDERILVFSDNDDTFKVMDELRKKGLKCEVLHGASGRVRNLIQAHKAGTINILFLNRKICGEGIHIPHANRLIFFHTLQNTYQYTQAIARANRFPRTTSLKVYHLLANDESV